MKINRINMKYNISQGLVMVYGKFKLLNISIRAFFLLQVVSDYFVISLINSNDKLDAVIRQLYPHQVFAPK